MDLSKQKRASALLTNVLVGKNFASPFIFHGADSKNLLVYAMEFASAIILQSKNANTQVKLQAGNHPDIVSIKPEGKSALFTMSDIRFFVTDIMLPPYESQYKVYILHDVDRMLGMHANALLKTLEEKPLHAVIILTTPDIKLLLPTVVSRCIEIPFIYEEEKKPKTSLTDLTIKALNEASLRTYKNLFATISELDKVLKEDPAGFDEVLMSYAEYFFTHHKDKGFLLQKALQVVADVKESLDRHTRPKTALEYLFLKILSF